MRKLTSAVLIVDSAEKSADLLYSTGFRTPDPIVCLLRGRETYVVIPQMEFGRAQKTRGIRAFTPQMLKLGRSQRRRLSGWALGLLRTLGVRRVTVPASFPYGTAQRLEKAGIHLSVAGGALLPGRRRKRPDEIEKIRSAQEAAVAAMQAAVGMIGKARVGRDGRLMWQRESLTSELVRAQINRVLLDHNCQGRDVIVAGGAAAADPHCRGAGPLRAGEPIVIDIFPQHLDHGYWGDLTRTVVKGEPSRELQRMYDAVKAAQSAALRAIHAGARTAACHEAVLAVFERRKFPTDFSGPLPRGFIHGTGHGVGLEVHEAPSLGMAPGRLQSGDVVTVEPGLYYPELGGIRIEDTVVVTRTGWRYLDRCEHVFKV